MPQNDIRSIQVTKPTHGCRSYKRSKEERQATLLLSNSPGQGRWMGQQSPISKLNCLFLCMTMIIPNLIQVFIIAIITMKVSQPY